MSLNPFQADPAVPERLARVPADRRVALAEAAAPLIRDGILAAADAADLVARFGLEGTADLMLLLLPQRRPSPARRSRSFTSAPSGWRSPPAI